MTGDLMLYSLGCLFMAVVLAITIPQLIKLAIEWVLKRRQDQIPQVPFGRRRG